MKRLLTSVLIGVLALTCWAMFGYAPAPKVDYCDYRSEYRA